MDSCGCCWSGFSLPSQFANGLEALHLVNIKQMIAV